MTAGDESSSGAIQQYINLLQSTPDASYIRTIILKALSDPAVFTGFSEIRSLPALQRLESSSSTEAVQSLFRTLDLFSYGTYRDYSTAAPGTYLHLAKAPLLKLKALTVVSIIHQYCEKHDNDDEHPSMQSRRSRRRNARQESSTTPSPSPAINVNVNAASSSSSSSTTIIPYSILQPELGMDGSTNIRELEDLFIHCIYSNLLPTGTKLNQKTMCVNLRLSPSTTSSSHDGTHVLCRDVNPSTDISQMIQTLEGFYNEGKNTKKNLVQSLENLKEDQMNEAREWRKVGEDLMTVEFSRREEERGTYNYDADYGRKKSRVANSPAFWKFGK